MLLVNLQLELDWCNLCPFLSLSEWGMESVEGEGDPSTSHQEDQQQEVNHLLVHKEKVIKVHCLLILCVLSGDMRQLRYTYTLNKFDGHFCITGVHCPLYKVAINVLCCLFGAYAAHAAHAVYDLVKSLSIWNINPLMPNRYNCTYDLFLV